jgi:hypothetical protein
MPHILGYAANGMGIAHLMLKKEKRSLRHGNQLGSVGIYPEVSGQLG